MESLYIDCCYISYFVFSFEPMRWNKQGYYCFKISFSYDGDDDYDYDHNIPAINMAWCELNDQTSQNK